MIPGLVPILSVLFLAGCGKSVPSPAPAPVALPAEGAPAPTWDELRDATFHGIGETEQPLALKGGRWEGPPLVEGGAARPAVELLESMYLSGDLNGDGADEAVVLLAESSGGTGVNSYLAVVGRRGNRLENLGTALLGDRVQLRGATLEGRRIRVDLVQGGPTDAACCPGELASRTLELSDKGLNEPIPARLTGRLTLATLANRDWLLRAWNVGEPAPDVPPVTLMLTDGRIAGSAGCNSYSAAVTDGEGGPGAIVIGPIGSTRKICEPSLSDVEDRYLGSLSHVTRYGFWLGHLALTYATDTGVGTLLFEEKR
jgi:heat shock protein HslJ